MKTIMIAVGSKENIIEDIHILAGRFSDHPVIVIAQGKDLRRVIIEKASNLFLTDNLVIAVIDPDAADVRSLKPNLDVLKERAGLIIYLTSESREVCELLEVQPVVLEKDKDKRIKERVRGALKRNGKKMTDKAFVLLTSRIRDESIVEQEVLKLIGYVGDRTTIDSKDISMIVTETHEDTLMVLFDAFSRMDKKEVLNVFEGLVENGQHILAIHSYLVNQMRLLIQAKDLEPHIPDARAYPAFAPAFKRWKEEIDIETSGKKRYLPFQHPYYAYKLFSTSRKLPRQRLIDFYEFLCSLDVKIKTGTKHDRTFMEYGLLKV
ncbi:MAG: polymerase delta subunit [Deltaproteobacteria bacterium]|nr:polymerase delta subunit [Deltaproteobacteria bacterium]